MVVYGLKFIKKDAIERDISFYFLTSRMSPCFQRPELHHWEILFEYSTKGGTHYSVTLELTNDFLICNSHATE